MGKYEKYIPVRELECNIPPVEARAGTAFPRDVPRAVAERSEAELSRPEGHPSIKMSEYTTKARSF